MAGTRLNYPSRHFRCYMECQINFLLRITPTNLQIPAVVKGNLLVEISTVHKNNEVFMAMLLNNDIFHDHCPIFNRDGTVNGSVR
jgi:hypothetical protein